MRLEQEAQGDTLLLSEEQIRLLEKHSCDWRMRHIEVNAPGELLNQDTFHWGTIKGVGKVYVQVVVDAFCSLAFAKVRSGPKKLDSFFRVFKCTVASGYAALVQRFSFVEYVVGGSVVKSLVRPLFVKVAQVIGNPLPGLGSPSRTRAGRLLPA